MNLFPQNWDTVLIGFLCYGIVVVMLVWVLRWRERPSNAATECGNSGCLGQLAHVPNCPAQRKP